MFYTELFLSFTMTTANRKQSLISCVSANGVMRNLICLLRFNFPFNTISDCSFSPLTFSWRRSLSYRKQSIDLHSSDRDDRDLCHWRVKKMQNKARRSTAYSNWVNHLFLLYIYQGKNGQNRYLQDTQKVIATKD